MNYPTTRRMGGRTHLSHPLQPQPPPSSSSSTSSLSNHRRRSFSSNNGIGQNRGSRGVNTTAAAATMNLLDKAGSRNHHTINGPRRQQHRMYNSSGRPLPSATRTTTRMLMPATTHHQSWNTNKNVRSSSSSSPYVFNRMMTKISPKHDIYPQQQQHQDRLLSLHHEEELEDQQQHQQQLEWRDVNNDADFPMSQVCSSYMLSIFRSSFLFRTIHFTNPRRYNINP